MAKETAEEKAEREAREREADAEATGTGGAAKNGEPVDLASRRRGKSANSQLATDGSETPDDQEEEHDGQMAWEPDPAGKRMSLGSLIPRNCPVEYKTKIDGKSVDLKGGLNDPQREQIAVSALRTSGFTISYTRDDRGDITKVIVTEHKEARAVNPAKSEAGQLLLAQVPEDPAPAANA